MLAADEPSIEMSHITEMKNLTLPADDGEIVVGMVFPRYDLSKLLEQATPENLHLEIDLGAVQGSELLQDRGGLLKSRLRLIRLDIAD